MADRLTEALSGADAEECARVLREIADGSARTLDPAVLLLVESLTGDDRSALDPPPSVGFHTAIAELALRALARLGRMDAIERAARTPKIVEVPDPNFDQGVYIGCWGTRPRDIQACAAELLAQRKPQKPTMPARTSWLDALLAKLGLRR